MKILSLDTSTTISGYAIFEDEQLIHYSSIDHSKIKDSDIRMNKMITTIFYQISHEHPDVVVVEEMVVPRNPQTQRMLTMILGAIYGYCIVCNINYCSLRPTQWRSAHRQKNEKLPRKREELKIWSMEKVNELFGVENVDDNIADAILIGKAYLNREQET